MTITILITTIIVIEVIPRPDPGAPAFMEHRLAKSSDLFI